jgi:hypothetical protein
MGSFEENIYSLRVDEGSATTIRILEQYRDTLEELCELNAGHEIVIGMLSRVNDLLNHHIRRT